MERFDGWVGIAVERWRRACPRASGRSGERSSLWSSRMAMMPCAEIKIVASLMAKKPVTTQSKPRRRRERECGWELARGGGRQVRSCWNCRGAIEVPRKFRQSFRVLVAIQPFVASSSLQSLDSC